MTRDELKKRSSPPPPRKDPEPTAEEEALTLHFVELAIVVGSVCPDGREQSVAFTKLDEAYFWASAGVARGSG